MRTRGRRSTEFVDPQRNSGTTAHEKLQTRIDTDHIPLIFLAKILFVVTAEIH